MLNELGGFEIRELTQKDATHPIALGVMQVQLEAYVDRFGEEFRTDLQQAIAADPQNKHHIAVTCQLIATAKSNNWCWFVALSTGASPVKVYGFVVCIVQEQGIFLAEIHTHPRAQRRGLARQLLYAALRSLCADGRAGSDTAIWLGVVRNNAQVLSHPAKWYHSLGFVGGDWTTWQVGQTKFDIQNMTGTVGTILRRLSDG